MRIALALFVGLFLIVTGGRMLGADLAHGMTIAVQDQGADPTVVQRTAQDMGANTVRIVVTTQDPHAELVKTYRDLGLNVQAAIVVKRTTTPAQVLQTVRAWKGMVRTVSVGNEPELNGVSACRYARIFSASYKRLKKTGITVGFGELSPVRAFEYINDIARCHVRIRADFTAVHPYQFFSDPLGAPTERSGVGTWLGMGNLGRLRSVLRRHAFPSRLRATEFSYLVDGRYKVSMAKATSMWPRAVKQARKHVQQLVIYGLGTVPAGTWGSAALLDSNGRRTPAYVALARALGRTLQPEHEPPVPSSGLLPDGTTDHWQVVEVPVVPATDAKNDEPDKGDGASVQEPDEVDDVEPPRAPAICEDDDISDADWDANGCEAFYPEEPSEPEPVDTPSTEVE